ncbi:MAG: SPOR domain-containing protein [Longimicrobiales bacterium]
MPFDPVIGADSPVLEALVHGPSSALSAVLLIAGPEASRTGFGAAAAIAVADAWTTGERVPVLVDLGLENPELHGALGTDNDEGVADAVVFGTSLRLLARTMEGHRFSFVSAGYASDPEEVRASGDWRRIIAQEAAAGHTLLLYAQADAPGLDVLAGKVGAVIVIGEASDLPAAADSLPRPYAIVAVLTPPPSPPLPQPPPPPQPSTHGIVGGGVVPSSAEFEASPESPDEISASEDLRPARRSPPLIADDVAELMRAEAGASSKQRAPESAPPRVSDEDFDRIRVRREGAGREQLIADLRSRQRSAMMSPPPREAGVRSSRAAAGATIDGIDRRGEAPPVSHTRTVRESAPTGTLPGEPPRLKQGAPRAGRPPRSPWLLPMLVLALAVILAGAVYYVQWRAERRAAPVAMPVRTAIPPVDSLAMVPLPFVVAVEAHTQLATAEERLAALTAGAAREHFFVAPLVREDVPYYHVFAGPLSDSSAAAQALDSLLVHKVKTGSAAGDVRQVPFSFLVDQFDSEGAARGRVAELQKIGIPTFVVAGSVHGSDVWRVYGGAYSGLAEADVMRQLLKAAGVKDSLVTRTGRSNQ